VGSGYATAERSAGASASIIISGRGNAWIDDVVRQVFPESEVAGIATRLSKAKSA